MTFLRAWLFVNMLGLVVTHAFADDDIAAECAQAGIGSVSSLLGNDAPAFIETSTDHQIAARYSPAGYAAWALAMYPSAKARMGGVRIQLAHIEKMRQSLGPAPYPPLADWFEEVSRSRPMISRDTRAFLRSSFRKWRLNPILIPNLVALRTGVPYFCSYFGSSGCVGPVNRLISWMRPRPAAGWTVSLVDLWEKVLTDSEYYAGLARGAARIHRRVAEAQMGRSPPGAASDVFSDLVEGYRAVGKPEAEARDRAFDILGVYATRGASNLIAYDLARPETAPLIAALTFVSSAMSYLDLVQPPGRYYSMPGTSGTCAFGKPYHFWMTAYFVHRLPSERISVREAVIASHIVGRVYETYSNSVGRSSDQAFHEALLSVHNNQIRANIVVNDAGAIWAAENGARELDLDGGIVLLKNKAVPLPVMTPQQLNQLLKRSIERDKAWVRMIQPDVLIQEWLGQARQ